jgi:hypothetical protein
MHFVEEGVLDICYLPLMSRLFRDRDDSLIFKYLEAVNSHSCWSYTFHAKEKGVWETIEGLATCGSASDIN